MKAFSKKEKFGFLSVLIMVVVLWGSVYATLQTNTVHTIFSSAYSKPTDGYGIYEACPPNYPPCFPRLSTIALGGFSEIINYSQYDANSTINDDVAYANAAHNNNIKVIWPIYRFIYSSNAGTDVLTNFPALTNSMNSSGQCPHVVNSNYWFIICFVHILYTNSGTWGWYVGDETPTSSEPNLRHIIDAIYDAGAGSQPRLYVASSNPFGYVYTSEVDTYGKVYYDGYRTAADANVISEDYYPVGTSEASNLSYYTGIIASGLLSFANGQHTQYGMVLQAHSLYEYKSGYSWCTSLSVCPYPTAAQETASLDAVLSHPLPRIILFYSYFDLLRSDNYTKHWADLTSVVGGSVIPTSTPTATPTATPTPTHTPTPTPTSTTTPAPTITHTPTPTSIPTITHTTTPTATPVVIYTPTTTPNVTATPASSQIQIVNSSTNTPISNAQLNFTANGRTYTESTDANGFAEVPSNNSTLDNISVNGVNIGVQTPLSQSNGYKISVNPKTGNLTQVLAYSGRNLSYIWTILLGTFLVILLSVSSIFIKKREGNPFA